MKSFNQFIEESFDSKPFLFTKTKETKMKTTYVFKTNDGLPYTVVFMDWDKEGEHYETGFFLTNGNADYALTGTGNQHQVMITVISIVKEFLQNAKNLKTLTFSAAKEEGGKRTGRSALYKRLVNKYIDKSKFEVISRDTGDNSNETLFTIKAKN